MKTKKQPAPLALPETGLLRVKQVLQFIPVSESCWWNGVKSGRFPAPVRLGPKITCWRAEDIRAYIESANAEGRDAA